MGRTGPDVRGSRSDAANSCIVSVERQCKEREADALEQACWWRGDGRSTSWLVSRLNSHWWRSCGSSTSVRCLAESRGAVCSALSTSICWRLHCAQCHRMAVARLHPPTMLRPDRNARLRMDVVDRAQRRRRDHARPCAEEVQRGLEGDGSLARECRSAMGEGMGRREGGTGGRAVARYSGRGGGVERARISEGRVEGCEPHSLSRSGLVLVLMQIL